MLEEPEVVYRINSQDEITFVNKGWQQFAQLNHSSHLLPEHVLKRSLWNFISDITTRQLYRDTLQRVRSGRTVRFHFRCDTPNYHRLLEITINPAPLDAVQFHTQVVSIKPRPPVPLLSPQVPRTDDLLRICGWYKKVTLENGTWVEVEEAVEQLQLFNAAALPLLSHGVCNQCYQNMYKMLAEDDTTTQTYV